MQQPWRWQKREEEEITADNLFTITQLQYEQKPPLIG